MDENLKILLYRSFEEQLNQEEYNKLEDGLENSFELREEKEKIIRIRRILQTDKIDTFKPFFADRVMNKLEAAGKDLEEDSLFESLFFLFKPVAIAATALIIVIACYNIVSTGQFSLEGAMGIPEVTVDDAYEITVAVVMEEE
jgi:hypothetical protein